MTIKVVKLVPNKRSFANPGRIQKNIQFTIIKRLGPTTRIIISTRSIWHNLQANYVTLLATEYGSMSSTNLKGLNMAFIDKLLQIKITAGLFENILNTTLKCLGPISILFSILLNLQRYNKLLVIDKYNRVIFLSSREIQK